MIYHTIESYDYKLSKSESLLHDFIENCPYRFTKGKHIGGCGVSNAPKRSDTKGGCARNVDNSECPRMEYYTLSG